MLEDYGGVLSESGECVSRVFKCGRGTPGLGGWSPLPASQNNGDNWVIEVTCSTAHTALVLGWGSLGDGEVTKLGF